MPSLLSKFKPLARLRERARPSKTAKGKVEAQPHAASSSTADAAVPAVTPDQQLHPHQAVVDIDSKACPAPAHNTVLGTDADVDPPTRHGAVVTKPQQVQPSTLRATPPTSPTPPAPPLPCMLEALPAELRLQVFSHISDLRDLRALVLASPVFCQQYSLDRQPILGQVLVSSLGNLMPEAYAVQKAPTFDLWVPQSDAEGMAEQFIHQYFSRRLAPPEMILQDCTLADLEDMAAFHQTIVRPLLSQCATLSLRNLDPSLEVGSLSVTEQTRLLRALYRFELFCNLFGQGPEAGRVRPVPGLSVVAILTLLFGPLRPWEVEEVDCIYMLIRNKYDQVFDTIGRDLENPWIPKREDRPRTPPGFWDSNETGTDRASLIEGTAMRGLRLFSEVLEILEDEDGVDEEDLVLTMTRYQVRARHYEGILNNVSQDIRRDLYPSESDAAEAGRERLPFSGDTEDGPSLAWVVGWSGRYMNRYGTAIPAALKAWGHVFWDRRRLITSKGLHDVLRERDGCY